MMFVLHGGPRDGQLVDELPPGYLRTDDPAVAMFEEFTAQHALWSADGVIPLR